MDKHGKGIVEAVVKEAVEKQMRRGVKNAPRKAVENTGVKARTKRSREREWSVKVAVDAEEERWWLRIVRDTLTMMSCR